MKNIVYVPQDNWDRSDFYGLHRYLSKLFLQAERRMAEIQSLDLSKMSTITKTFIYVILKFQAKENFLDFENLQPLVGTAPLESRLDLVDDPVNCHAIYNEYNIGL